FTRFTGIQNLAFENPHFHTDNAIRRMRFVRVVIDISAQRVKRHATFAIPLGACDLGATKTTTHHDLHALCALAQCVLYHALHSATEHYPTLELLGDVDGNQFGIEIRLADFLDIDLDRHTHPTCQVFAQLVDVFAFLANHDAWTGSVNGYTCGLGRTLDDNTAYRCRRQLALQILANSEIGDQVLRIVLAAGIPDRVVITDDA